MNKTVTKGMWELQKLEDSHHDYDSWQTFAIRSSQNVCLAVVGEVDHYHELDHEGNAELIVTAVNACKAINPEHPELVAENIENMYQLIKKIAHYSHGYYAPASETGLTNLLDALLSKCEAK